MKKIFLQYAMTNISNNTNYSEEKLEEIAYGLEAIYLTITKMVVLFAISIILGIVKDFLLVLIFYNLIRVNAFGIHASKSIHCLIMSFILFIGGALLCKYVNITQIIIISTSILPTTSPFGDTTLLSIICLLLCAPSDTHKRPLINKRKRNKYKMLSVLAGIIYLILIIVLKDNSIVNYIWLGLIEATLMILPVTYKIFNQPYNNYKTYNSGV